MSTVTTPPASYIDRKRALEAINVAGRKISTNEGKVFDFLVALVAILIRTTPDAKGRLPPPQYEDKGRRAAMVFLGKESKACDNVKGHMLPTWNSILMVLGLWNLGKIVQPKLLDQFLAWFPADRVCVGDDGTPTVSHDYFKSLMHFNQRIHKEWGHYNDFIQWFRAVVRVCLLYIASDLVFLKRWADQLDSFENEDYDEDEDKRRDYDRCSQFAWLAYVFHKSLYDEARASIQKNSGDAYQPLKEGYKNRLPIYDVKQFLEVVGGYSCKLYYHNDSIDLANSVMGNVLPDMEEDDLGLKAMLLERIKMREEYRNAKRAKKEDGKEEESDSQEF